MRWPAVHGMMKDVAWGASAFDVAATRRTEKESRKAGETSSTAKEIYSNHAGEADPKSRASPEWRFHTM